MELMTWLRLQLDRVLAVLCLVVGVVVLVVGWIGVSSTEYIAKQIPLVVSGGIGGLMFLMVGATLWLSADLSDEWSVLDRLEQQRQADHEENVRLGIRLAEIEEQQAGFEQYRAATKAVAAKTANGRNGTRRTTSKVAR
jgi:hypothetical protein